MLEHYLGLKALELVATDRTDAELSEFTGQYETIAAVLEVSAARGALAVLVTIKPETLRAMRETGEDAPEEQPPFRLGLVAGTDQYVVTEGPAAGMRGYFSRDADGRVDGVDLGGRLASRVPVSV